MSKEKFAKTKNERIVMKGKKEVTELSEEIPAGKT